METIKRKAGRPVGIMTNPVKNNHPVYRCWTGMKQRCLNPNRRNYHRYGGRGITVCERWLGKDGFKNFYADMGEMPSRDYSIDRIDNDGNYEPSNCQWITKSENSIKANTGRSWIANPNSLRQRAKRAGLSYPLVYQRIHINGWSEKQALTVPKMKIGAQFGHPNYRNGTYKRRSKQLSKAVENFVSKTI